MSDAMNDYYHTYKSEYARSVGLPYYRWEDGWTVTTLSDRGKALLSKSRCNKLKVPVADNEQPAGFKKVTHGYAPLYDRTGMVKRSKILDEEIVSILE